MENLVLSQNDKNSSSLRPKTPTMRPQYFIHAFTHSQNLFPINRVIIPNLRMHRPSKPLQSRRHIPNPFQPHLSAQISSYLGTSAEIIIRYILLNCCEREYPNH